MAKRNAELESIEVENHCRTYGEFQMICPKCGGSNVFKSSFLDLYSCNDCEDPNTWTEWQQEEIHKLQEQLAEETKKNWKNVCSSEVFQELKHGKYRHVLLLLQDQQISIGKCAQAIAEIANGVEPILPKYRGEDILLPGEE